MRLFPRAHGFNTFLSNDCRRYSGVWSEASGFLAQLRAVFGRLANCSRPSSSRFVWFVSWWRCLSGIFCVSVRDGKSRAVLQLDHVAVGIGNVGVWESAAMLPARDKLSACPLDLFDRPIVIVDVELEPEVLESASHPDRLVRVD
jgi:hypothetical protein